MMAIIALVSNFGIKALRLIIGKNLKPILEKEEMKTILAAVKIIKKLTKKLNKDIGKRCWYKSSCDCNYHNYPTFCYLKVEMLESGKKLSDLKLTDLESCKYRIK